MSRTICATCGVNEAPFPLDVCYDCLESERGRKEQVKLAMNNKGDEPMSNESVDENEERMRERSALRADADSCSMEELEASEAVIERAQQEEEEGVEKIAGKYASLVSMARVVADGVRQHGEKARGLVRMTFLLLSAPKAAILSALVMSRLQARGTEEDTVNFLACLMS